jgi:hypothetical protein
VVQANGLSGEAATRMRTTLLAAVLGAATAAQPAAA